MPRRCASPAYCLFFAVLVLIGCGGSSTPSDGGGGAGGNAEDGGSGGGAIEATCPGFESSPGAGCPAPCEPLVPGGPDGRAYCTVTCPTNSDVCPAGHGCTYASGMPAPGTVQDVCMPGLCDATAAGSCPDDMACSEIVTFCFPSPGAKATRCQPFAASSEAECTGVCPIAQPLEEGVLCTIQCVAIGAGTNQCFAGDQCNDDGEQTHPFGSICVPGCFDSADCPEGVECSERACFLF